MLLEKLVQFASYFEAYKQDQRWIKEQIIQGLVNNTIDYIIEDGQVVAFVRYNIINDGRVADILDLLITKGNGIKTIRHFVSNGLLRFPSLKYIRFEREAKNRPHKIVDIEKFL